MGLVASSFVPGGWTSAGAVLGSLIMYDKICSNNYIANKQIIATADHRSKTYDAFARNNPDDAEKQIGGGGTIVLHDPDDVAKFLKYKSRDLAHAAIVNKVLPITLRRTCSTTFDGGNPAKLSVKMFRESDYWEIHDLAASGGAAVSSFSPSGEIARGGVLVLRPDFHLEAPTNP